jgi:magnesium chelatase family protein
MIRDFHELPSVLEEAAIQAAHSITNRRGVLLTGAPAASKTMLAARLAGIVELHDHARRWLTAECEGMGIRFNDAPPFRAPHYTISQAAMVGTQARELVRNRNGKPTGETREITRGGEVDLARYGVMFLDELTEFSTGTLRALRMRMDAMEDSAPRLVASSALCPCGLLDSGSIPQCSCSGASVVHFQDRLLAAMDLVGIRDRVSVPQISIAMLRDGGARCRSTSEIRREVRS